MNLRNTRLIVVSTVMALMLSLSGFVAAQATPTGKLAEVIERGRLICGVSGTLPGFSFLDPDTNVWSGFDADFCRVTAAAIFGEATDETLEFVALTAAERFTALQTGQVDVLFRNTTWTLSRDTDLQGDFVVTTFYDGQGLMVPVDLGVSSIEELDGARICTQSGTTTELNITDAMTSRGFSFELVPLETSGDTFTAFEGGQCDVLTSDKSQLASLRSSAADPSLYTILPDTLSKEPLGPMWIQGDAQWGDVIKWSVYATMHAEEYGITSENIDSMMGSDSPDMRRFLGEEGDLGAFLGLSNDFAYNIIKNVGNYGEIYSSNLDPVGIARDGSLNALYTEGGLMYAPAWR